MPTLPTIDVTQEQATRLLAVFSSVEEYRNWLKATLTDYVIAEEQRVLQLEQREQQQIEAQKLKDELGVVDPVLTPNPHRKEGST